MKSTTSFFLKAALVALVLYGTGFCSSIYREHRTATAKSKCEDVGRKQVEAFNAAQKGKIGPWTIYQSGPLNCDPLRLYTDTAYSDILPGAQGELLEAYRGEQSGIDNTMYGFAIFALFIGIIPMSWYFFLARLREVASAIRRG